MGLNWFASKTSRLAADMCKHVAAALYGVGARLDERPQLLFVLRGVDESELLADAGQDLARSKPAPTTAKVLDDGDVAALFGLEMAEGAAVGEAAPAKPESARPAKRAKRRTAERTTALAAKEPGSQRAVRTKANGVAKAKGRAKKKIGRRRKKASR